MRRTQSVRTGRLIVGSAAVALLASTTAGCADIIERADFAAAPSAPLSTPGDDVSTAAPPPSPGVDANARALAALDTLPVKGRAPKTGYARDQFGQAWSDDVSVDDGHNGCDTRNDILRRDLVSVSLKPGSCAVQSGTLHDPYTGTAIEFRRGPSSSAVQIDHLVALSDAWQKGAQQLSAEQRRNLANDPRNLQATDGRTNQKKGDGDAATWLPPAKSYRCVYVARQIDVKGTYHLWVTPAEKSSMARILTRCGDSPAADSATPAGPPPAPPAPGTTGDSVDFASCAAARAAGAAPLRRGDPGYRSGLDGDGDGVACEGT
ncbi:DUF1524 domain-containing protein [Gordonia sp. CPCC 206044]|uniref:GmrSD restriction endonuclease domain-containing protein n=1 Tax=Gordonia sp. CPCC 206044 TaxID=3140793 RepID=UPI003AF3A74A